MSGLRFKVSEIQVSTNLIPPSRDTAYRVRNIHDAIFYFGGHGMPCPYKLSSVLCYLLSVICYLLSVICHLYSVHFLPLRQGEYHEVGRGYDVSFTFHFPLSVFRFPLSVFRFPLISYPLPLRVLPLSQGEKVSGHLKPEPAPPLTPSAICYLPSVIRTLSSVLCTPDNSLLLSLRTGTSHRG